MNLIYLFILLAIPLTGRASSLTLSGNPSPFIISKATAGKEPDPISDVSTTYSIQVRPFHTVAILAALDSPMPTYTSLKISLQAPSKAQSFPSTSLDTNAKPLVINISEGIYNNLQISYEYTTTVKAGVLPLSAKTILFTVLETTNAY